MHGSNSNIIHKIFCGFNEALTVVENVGAVEEIGDLPATVVPDDEEAVAAIEEAKKSMMNCPIMRSL